MKVLLGAGADPSSPIDGLNALDLVAREGALNSSSWYPYTLNRYFRPTGHDEVVKVLMDTGLDLQV